MTYIGIAAIAIGIAWWLFSSRTPSVVASTDKRADLFAAYTTISDHVDSIGTPEQKAALLLVLPAIASKPQ